MRDKIEALVEKIKLSRLRELSFEVSERYRKGVSPYLQTEDHRLAYLVTRFPATFAALQKVFSEIPHFEIASLLDLGAGPGTGWLAAREAFPLLSQGTLIESDSVFIRLGKTLLHNEPVVWLQNDFILRGGQIFHYRSIEPIEHDLVLLSYSIGEIPEKYWDAILNTVWSAAKRAVVIVEPGTPAGFRRIRILREKLLALGAHMIAPCPHAENCPMAGSDWCHFAARVQRSSLHRQVKEGTLGFEDEKFSYLIMGKQPNPLPQARILRHPLKQKGHVSLTVCTAGGIKNKIVTRKDEQYRIFRKLSWGSKL